MWQRFTERARKVVFYAQEEAQRFNHNYLSTEHLLLGICRESDGLAARVLNQLGASPTRVEAEIAKSVAKNDGERAVGMSLTPRAKRVIDLAYEEARRFGNNYIGTEHLLLGLIREHDGMAARVLATLGIELEAARSMVVEAQSANGSRVGDLESMGSALGGILARMLRRHRRSIPDLLAEILLADESQRLWQVLQSLKINVAESMLAVSEGLSSNQEDESQLMDHTQLTVLIRLALEEAAVCGQLLGPEHFIPAIFIQESSHFSQYLRSRGVTLDGIRAALKEVQG